MKIIDPKDVLDFIPADIDYDSWSNVTCAFKKAGGSKSEWVNWSSKSPKFKKADEKKWSNGKTALNISTLIFHAKEHGYDEKKHGYLQETVDNFKRRDGMNNYSKKANQKIDHITKITNEIEEELPKYKLLDNIELLPYAVTPSKNQAELQLRHLYGLDAVVFCCKNNSYETAPIPVRVGDLPKTNDISHFKINCSNKGENVTEFKHCLIESDDIPASLQWEIIQRLKLPVASAVWTGNKSIHAIIKLDAKDREEYEERRDLIYSIVDSCGFNTDKSCKDPTRYTRLAGGVNVSTGQPQGLMGVSVGAKNWNEFEANILPQLKVDTSSAVDDKLTELLFDGELDDFDNIVLGDELIEGLLHEGKLFCLAGAPKSGKSLMASAISTALSTGGDFMGRKCKKSKVLHFDTEMDEDDFKRRRRVLEKNENLNIVLYNILEKKHPVKGEAPMTRIKRYLMMIESAVRSRGFDVIVFDCLYKFINENDIKEVSLLLDYIQSIRALGATVIIVHHSNKSKFEGGDPMAHLAGHSNIQRAFSLGMIMLSMNKAFVFEDGTISPYFQLHYQLRSFATPPPTVVYLNKNLAHNIDKEESERLRNKEENNLKSTKADDTAKNEIKGLLGCTGGTIARDVFATQISVKLGISPATVKSKRLKSWTESDFIKVVKVGKETHYTLGDKLLGEEIRFMQEVIKTDQNDDVSMGEALEDIF